MVAKSVYNDLFETLGKFIPKLMWSNFDPVLIVKREAITMGDGF